MQVAVFIASRSEPGEPAILRNGDRAAVHWGVGLAGNTCQVRFPAGDNTARDYAAAVGANCEHIDERDTSTLDVVLIGPGAADACGDELAGRLSERLSAELLFGVLQLERQGTSWSIVCDAGQGAREILRVAGPVVLVVSDEAQRPPYVSRHRLAHAARGVSLVESVASPAASWQAVTPRPPRVVRPSSMAADDRADSIFGIDSGAQDTRGKQIIAADPAVCAQVLLRYLLHHGFVTRTVPASDELPIAIARSAESSRPGTISGSSPTAVTATAVELSSALKRRPRPVNAGLVPGRRGPFRLATDMNRAT